MGFYRVNINYIDLSSSRFIAWLTDNKSKDYVEMYQAHALLFINDFPINSLPLINDNLLHNFTTYSIKTFVKQTCK